jgi:hypothetical protein
VKVFGPSLPEVSETALLPNATPPELLAAAQPSFAVISGIPQSLWFARVDVLNRLEKSGARVDRSDVDGAINFLSRPARRYPFTRRSPVLMSISAVSSSAAGSGRR